MKAMEAHQHHGHADGEWYWACCACPSAAPDPGCDYCRETYYRNNEPSTYRLFKDEEAA